MAKKLSNFNAGEKNLHVLFYIFVVRSELSNRSKDYQYFYFTHFSCFNCNFTLQHRYCTFQSTIYKIVIYHAIEIYGQWRHSRSRKRVRTFHNCHLRCIWVELFKMCFHQIKLKTHFYLSINIDFCFD